MKQNKLDKIDRQILSLLQQSGRMTNVELAERVGISAPPCLRRMKALEENGIIQGYHANIDGTVFGYTVVVFAFVKLEKQSEKDLVAFEEYIGSLPAVRECHMLAGDVDCVLKIVAQDWDDYQEFLRTRLTTAPNVQNVKSSLSVRSVKEEFGIPIDSA